MEKLAKQIIGRYPSQKFFNWPKDWVLKLISLCFAVFLWYFVVGEDKIDTNIIVPVEIVNLPRDLVISNQFKKQLEVTVSGPRGLINGLAKQHITRPVNLSKATPGTVVIRNEPQSIPFPRGINTLRIQPTHITLLIDRLIEKNLPITAEHKGTPPKDFELDKIILDPPIITISGPQAVLDGKRQLVTEPIDITDLKGTTTTQVALDLDPAIVDLIGETVVNARVIITEKTAERTVSGIPVEFTGNTSEGTTYTVTPKSIEVKAKIPLSILKNTNSLKQLFTAKIVADNLDPGKYELPVIIPPPDRVELLAITPESVVVEIRPIKSNKKSKPKK